VPNGWRRLAGLMAAGSMVLAAMAAPPAALAAGSLITVTTLSDSRAAGDGQCSLREAITAANLNIGNTNNDCNDGQSGESDQVQFSVDGTVLLTSNLPAITDSVWIDGHLSVKVDGQDSYTPFSIIGGGLELSDIVVQNGFGAFGGAITNGSSVIIRNTTIRSSGATYGGGIHNNGSMLVIASTIEGNTAGNAGGGIFNEDSIVLKNVTLAGNRADEGGGLYQSTGESTLRHVTVSLNTAELGAGVRRAGGTMGIINSLIANNAGSETSGSPLVNYSLVQGSSAGVLDTAGLASNGGPTRTIRLVGGANPALSIGDPDHCNDVGYVDQRGFARPTGAFDKCDAGSVQRDRVAPTMTVSPKVSLRPLSTLSGTSLRARVTSWNATDGDGIGLARYSLQKQVNGGSWTTVSTNVPTFSDTAAIDGLGVYNVTLSKDKTYRFRIRAVDRDGNVSDWRYTPTVKARLLQQTSDAVHYSTGWRTASSTRFSGGSVKHTATAGKSVRITFTGRGIALITSVRAGQELHFDLYIDGVYVGPSVIGYSTTSYRVQFPALEFPSSATHTIRLVVTDGSARFDVDAFAILK
jgi:CSLREA domain-containing protein